MRNTRASVYAACQLGGWGVLTVAYRRDRGHVEGEGWSGGAEEGR
jgi:hypothetical protein